VATATLTNTVVGISAVTATLSNSSSQTVDTSFVGDTATAHIAEGNLTVTANNALANGTAANAVRAVVTDAQGNLLAGQTVTFTATNGAIITTVIGVTGADGVATATLTNTTAGVSAVTATLSNSNNRTVDTTFVADAGTAQIADGNLTVTANNALANGTAANAVRAVVTDAQGNPLAGQTVAFTATNGATVTTVIGTTGADGVATATLTNTTAGVSAVTATLTNGNNKTVDTTFVADASTAQIASGNLTVTADNALANGTAVNAVRAVVTDAQGNPLAGQTVTFTATNGATVTTVIGTTGADGVATATLTNTAAGISAVTAALTNGNSASVDTTFVLDTTTATITEANLTVTVNNAASDGVAQNQVRAVVTNALGQVLPNQVVTFSATNGATVLNVTVTTDENGVAIANLTSTTAGVSVVTATLANNAARSVNVNFGANAFLASITLTEDDATANGLETNVVRVKVVDANGQPAANVVVDLTADNSVGTFHVVTPAGTATNAAGEIDIAYTYTRAFATPITVVATLPETGQTLTGSGGSFTIPTVKLTNPTIGVSNALPITATMTLLTARGAPLANTLLNVSVKRYVASSLADMPFITAASPVTTDSQGQAQLSATSTVSEDRLVFVLAAPGINEGQGEVNTIFDSDVTLQFY
ncbi:beta strand repeat-containing protein, partial [Martelella alba]